MGNYKGLNEGCEEYEINKKVWEAIGDASEKSGATIPSYFEPRPPNVASDKTSWTADTRSFWTLYIGPVLLQRHFKKSKYYRHFIELIKLLNACLQFEITWSEVDALRSGLAQWVRTYEK